MYRSSSRAVFGRLCALGILTAIFTTFSLHSGLAQRQQAWQWGAQLGPRYEVPGLSNVTAVKSGSHHRLALKSDGTVWAWGINWYGQLGDGTTTDHHLPAPVSGLSQVTLIAAGTYHSLIQKQDGTVWAWGYNDHGQLGDGTRTRRLVPVPVSGLTDVVALAGGGQHSLALKSDGTVWAWGWNAHGQMGDGTTTPRALPAPVSGLTDVVAISAGRWHSLALKSDGTVWMWGSYKLGMYRFPVPEQVRGLTDVVAVSGGYEHSLALRSDGTVWGWGNNSYEQLGYTGMSGQYDFTYPPVQLPGVTNVTSIASEFPYSMALRADGTLWTWGQHEPIAAGYAYMSFTPLQVCNLPDISAIAGGVYNAVLLRADGTVWAWGNTYINRNYALEDGMLSTRTIPSPVTELTEAIAIAAGFRHRLAVDANGTVRAWGDNHRGQLGEGSNIDRIAPVPVSGLNNVVSVAAGGQAWDTNPNTGMPGLIWGSHSLALKSDGTVWAWGWNQNGQLGDGMFTDHNTPVAVTNLTNVRAIAAGRAHSLALKSDGTVWIWGDGYSSTPEQIPGLTGVVAIAAGSNHNLAVRADGTVWAWGLNWYGQLGDGTTIDHNTPVPVSGLTDVIGVAAGDAHSMAVKSDGTVWTWGWNYWGELGDGTKTMRLAPVQVSGLNNVIKVAAAHNYSLAIQSDGALWGWGNNSYGQLLDGTVTERLLPVRSRVPRVTAIAAGAGNNIAIVPTGSVSGTLNLEGIDANAATQPITFVFRPAHGGASMVRTVDVSSSGQFTLPDIAQTLTTLHIKGAKYLAANVAVDTSNGNVSGVTALLRGGDANNDNLVDVEDLSLLIASFDASASDPNWYGGAADFDGNGVVDVNDLDLFIRNFDQEGDA